MYGISTSEKIGRDGRCGSKLAAGCFNSQKYGVPASRNLVAVGDTVALIPSDGMKRWGASSKGVRSESLICMVLSHRV